MNTSETQLTVLELERKTAGGKIKTQNRDGSQTGENRKGKERSWSHGGHADAAWEQNVASERSFHSFRVFSDIERISYACPRKHNYSLSSHKANVYLLEQKNIYKCCNLRLKKFKETTFKCINHKEQKLLYQTKNLRTHFLIKQLNFMNKLKRVTFSLFPQIRGPPHFLKRNRKKCFYKSLICPLVVGFRECKCKKRATFYTLRPQPFMQSKWISWFWPREKRLLTDMQHIT